MSEDQQQPRIPANLSQEVLRKRMEILREIHANGGQKTFVLGQVESECFRYLAGLEVDGLVELVPAKDPFAFTYRLVDKH